MKRPRKEQTLLGAADRVEEPPYRGCNQGTSHCQARLLSQDREVGEADTHPDFSSFLSCGCSTLHQTQQEVRGQRSPSRKVRGNDGGGMGLIESDVK